MIESIKEFLSSVISALIAISRLFFLTLSLLVNGLHIILFQRTEICNIEMKGRAWRCDEEKLMDKVSFIDKVCYENPELLDIAQNEAPTEEDGEDEE